MIYELPKYPRTYHIPGSKGMMDPNAVFLPRHVSFVVEEKLDGSSVSIGFLDGVPHIYHRNNPVSGPEFDLLKRFVAAIETELYLTLSERYIMYGEWLYAKHTIFYDQLPSYFIEYDVYDREQGCFLSTAARQDLLKNLHEKLVVSVPLAHLLFQIGLSNFVSLASVKSKFDAQLPVDDRSEENYTDLSGCMEGLYIKHEESGKVVGRYKFIRQDFVSKIVESGHWSKRPLLPNQLSETGRAAWLALLGSTGVDYA